MEDAAFRNPLTRNQYLRSTFFRKRGVCQQTLRDDLVSLFDSGNPLLQSAAQQ